MVKLRLHWTTTSMLQAYSASTQPPGNGTMSLPMVIVKMEQLSGQVRTLYLNSVPTGSFLVLGGQVFGWGDDLQTVDPTTVSIYEPHSMQWKTQATTGTQPPSMRSSCLEGAKGENGTYETSLSGSRRFLSANTTS